DPARATRAPLRAVLAGEARAACRCRPRTGHRAWHRRGTRRVDPRGERDGARDDGVLQRPGRGVTPRTMSPPASTARAAGAILRLIVDRSCVPASAIERCWQAPGLCDECRARRRPGASRMSWTDARQIGRLKMHGIPSRLALAGTVLLLAAAADARPLAAQQGDTALT